MPVVSDEVVSIHSLRLPEGDELSIPLSSASTEAGDIQHAIALYRELSKANEKAVDQFIPRWRAALGIPGSESILAMGYRIILLEMEEKPDPQLISFLRQFISFTRFRGADVHSKKPKEFPGAWDITIEGNSSFLNGLTDELAAMLVVIAADVNPQHAEIVSTATDIAAQLSEQLVDWSATPTVLPARPGRELERRFYGESSFVQLKDELRIHTVRIKSQLAKYRSAKGPTAWRQRHALQLPVRVDSPALLSAARRLRRIASDLLQRSPNNHLDAAITRFDQAAPNLILLRDIAEHMDEYSIGRGRRDIGNAEPSEVFSIVIEHDDVSIAARGQTLKVLATYEACLSLVNCLSEFSDHYALFYLMPIIADFDFGTFDGQRFVPVARDSETAEQSRQRALINQSRMQSNFKLPDKQCPECGEQL
jgi:hypothetical protein